MHYKDSMEPPYMPLVAPNCHVQVPVLSAIGRGSPGPRGEKGDQGDTGARGLTGKSGEDPRFTEFDLRYESQLAELNEKVQANTTQIESLSTLESGSTTGDAELIDGRITKHGDTLPNLGKHIRLAEYATVGKIAALEGTGTIKKNYFKITAANYTNTPGFYLGSIDEKTAVIDGALPVASSTTWTRNLANIELPPGLYILDIFTSASNGLNIQALRDGRALATTENIDNRYIQVYETTTVTLRLVVARNVTFSNDYIVGSITSVDLTDEYFGLLSSNSSNKYKCIKHHSFRMFGEDRFRYPAFASGVSINYDEVYVFRAAPEHKTVANNWGVLMFMIVDKYNHVTFKMLDIDYGSLPGELRDPNLSIINGTDIILSAFTTDIPETEYNTHRCCIFRLNRNLEVTSYTDNAFLDNKDVAWGNTVLSDDNHLLKCAYKDGVVKIYRSIEEYTGDLDDFYFEKTATLSATGRTLTECNLSIIDGVLYCITRVEGYAARLYKCQDTRGYIWDNGVRLMYKNNDFILHSPLIVNKYDANNFVIGGSHYLSDGHRPAVMAIMNKSTGVISFSHDYVLATNYGGYPGIVRIGATEYRILSYLNFSDGASLMYYETDLSRLMSGTY